MDFDYWLTLIDYRIWIYNNHFFGFFYNNTNIKDSDIINVPKTLIKLREAPIIKSKA